MAAEKIFEQTRDRLDKFAVLAAELDQNEATLKQIRKALKDDPEMMELVEQAEQDLAESRRHLEIGRAHLEPLRKLFY